MPSHAAGSSNEDRGQQRFELFWGENLFNYKTQRELRSLQNTFDGALVSTMDVDEESCCTVRMPY